MDITRRSDYACRMLRAAYKREGYISVTEISEAEDIPYTFARSIQHDLMKSGLVKTGRGAHGGLMLNCDPARATLLDVLNSVQGPVSVAICSHDPEYCKKQPECVYNCVWRGADKLLNTFFASITLDDLFTFGSDHPIIKSIFGDEGSTVEVCDIVLSLKDAQADIGDEAAGIADATANQPSASMTS